MILRTKVVLSASHSLPDYDGPCSSVHGHNWNVFVEVDAEPNPITGMIVDFSKVKSKLKELDHKNINDYISNPTAENMVEYLLKTVYHTLLKENTKWNSITIRVEETENKSVEGVLKNR